MEIFIFIVCALLLSCAVGMLVVGASSFAINTLLFAALKMGPGKRMLCKHGQCYFFNTLGVMGVSRLPRSRCAYCGSRKQEPKPQEIGFNFNKKTPMVSVKENVISVDFKSRR